MIYVGELIEWGVMMEFVFESLFHCWCHNPVSTFSTVCNLRDNLGISPSLAFKYEDPTALMTMNSYKCKTLLRQFDIIMGLHREAKEQQKELAFDGTDIICFLHTSLTINSHLFPGLLFGVTIE
jgi:hypothetical protein